MNLAAGDGHPAVFMDLSFALQALCARRIAEQGTTMRNVLYSVPVEIDREVAQRKLAALEVSIDTLTLEQNRYLHG